MAAETEAGEADSEDTDQNVAGGWVGIANAGDIAQVIGELLTDQE